MELRKSIISLREINWPTRDNDERESLPHITFIFKSKLLFFCAEGRLIELKSVGSGAECEYEPKACLLMAVTFAELVNLTVHTFLHRRGGWWKQISED